MASTQQGQITPTIRQFGIKINYLLSLKTIETLVGGEHISAICYVCSGMLCRCTCKHTHSCLHNSKTHFIVFF